ncbi:MAG: hypothetical protein KF699_02335 [Phycisphaeraceae bacterium]|nr:hypothetical protein [Phycisphaeraceae bacterium]
MRNSAFTLYEALSKTPAKVSSLECINELAAIAAYEREDPKLFHDCEHVGRLLNEYYRTEGHRLIQQRFDELAATIDRAHARLLGNRLVRAWDRAYSGGPEGLLPDIREAEEGISRIMEVHPAVVSGERVVGVRRRIDILLELISSYTNDREAQPRRTELMRREGQSAYVGELGSRLVQRIRVLRKASGRETIRQEHSHEVTRTNSLTYPLIGYIELHIDHETVKLNLKWSSERQRWVIAENERRGSKGEEEAAEAFRELVQP